MIDFLKEKVDLFVQLLVPCLRGEITIKISETPKKIHEKLKIQNSPKLLLYRQHALSPFSLFI